MVYASKLIEVAESQVGYLEKGSPDAEDSFTGNAGYNNYTKYGRDLVKWIGSPFADGVYWCMEFVTWCFVEAFGIDEAKKLLGGWTAYCPTAVNYFRNMGRFYTSNPQKGDVIFFYDSEGDAGHVGVVYDVDSSNIYTIEGNTSSSSGVVPNGGGVFKKRYSLGYSRIYGFGRPNYDKETNWIKTDKGWRYKLGDDVARNRWVQVNNSWYFFKSNGYMATDEYIKSSSYKVNGYLYYVDKSGVWNGKTYYWMKDNRGWWLTDGTWYAKNEWAKVDTKWYYFDDKGYMVHDKTITLKGKKYTFNADGTLKD